MQDIEEYLDKNYGKIYALALAQAMSEQPERIPDLLQIIYREEEPLSRRGAWYLSTLFDHHPQLIYPYTDEMIAQLERVKTPAIVRALLRTLSKTTLHEKHHGFLLQYTSECILSSKSEAAIQLFALDIFFQIAKIQPDLFFELENMIDIIYPEASKGIRNKCRNLIKDIEKIRSKRRF